MAPTTISLKQVALDIDFHPSRKLVATGLMNGELRVYNYPDQWYKFNICLNSSVWDNTNHAAVSCRAVKFCKDGTVVFTGYSNNTIWSANVETNSLDCIQVWDDHHGASVNRIVNLTESTFASGDDDGYIKIWDVRSPRCNNEFQAHDDYISDMTFASNHYTLLATSGDGQFSVNDLRRKVKTQTYEEEKIPSGVLLMKEGKLVVFGLVSGSLVSYNWERFEENYRNVADFEFQSIDTMVKYSEETILLGSGDGKIRFVNVTPSMSLKKNSGVATNYEYPVERLATSHIKGCFGSIGHDRMLTLWYMNNVEMVCDTESEYYESDTNNGFDCDEFDNGFDCDEFDNGFDCDEFDNGFDCDEFDTGSDYDESDIGFDI